jgi:hypothetical protein
MNLDEIDFETVNPRLLISNYFEFLVNEIDINAELILLHSDLTDEERQVLNQIRDKFIKKIKQVEEKNLNKYDTNSLNVDKQVRLLRKDDANRDARLFELLFQSGFCFVVNSDKLPKLFEFRLGILIVNKNPFLRTLKHDILL